MVSEEESDEESWVQAAPSYSAGAPRFRKSRLKSKGGVVSRSADKDPLVYKLTNMVNGKGYVGKATNSRDRMHGAPPRRAGDLRSDGESESEDWDLEDDWEFDASEDKRTGSDEAEAARGDLKVRMGVIYLIICLVNLKEYIGQTIQEIEARMRSHRHGNQYKTKSGRHTVLQNAIAKHGWHNFTWRVLERDIPEHMLDEREKAHIEERNTCTPNGYNLTKGGRGRGSWTDECRERHSEAMQEWAKSDASRKRKSEMWQDVDWNAARCAERKIMQNKEGNVQSRHNTWDAKRALRLAAIKDPQMRRTAIQQARNCAKQGVRKAFRRGVEGRDLWEEFYERWGSDEAWTEWLRSGSCDAPRGCPSLRT